MKGQVSQSWYEWVLTACVMFAVAGTGVASAQYSGQSVRFSKRPLNMPAATVRVDGDLSMISYPTLPGERDELFAMTAGISAAFTDKFELGAQLLPLRLSPNSEYLNPSVYGMYSLMKGDLETSFYGSVSLPVKDGFSIAGGLPVTLHINDMFRLNTGAWLGFLFSDANDTVGFEIPLQLAIQTSQQFFIGPEMGFCFGGSGRAHMAPQTANTCLYSFATDLDNFQAPFGMFGGYTFVGNSLSPLADWRFGFRSLDIGEGFDYWAVYTAFNLFLYL